METEIPLLFLADFFWGRLSGKVCMKAKSVTKLGALHVPGLSVLPFPWAVNNSWL